MSPLEPPQPLVQIFAIGAINLNPRDEVAIFGTVKFYSTFDIQCNIPSRSSSNRLLMSHYMSFQVVRTSFVDR